MAMAARALPFTAGRAPVGRLRDSIIRFGEMREAHPDINEVMPKARIVARGMDGMAMGLDRDAMLLVNSGIRDGAVVICLESQSRDQLC